MAVAVEDVPKWYVDRACPGGPIGHAVAGPGLGSGWAMMACRMTTPIGHDDMQDDAPKRICRKCREALKHVTLKEKR
jgi:hypothetical protein